MGKTNLDQFATGLNGTRSPWGSCRSLDCVSIFALQLDLLREQGVQLREIDYTPFDEVARLLYEGPWVAERYVATLSLIEEQPGATNVESAPLTMNRMFH